MSVNIGDTIQDGSVVWEVKAEQQDFKQHIAPTSFDFNDKTKAGIYECDWVNGYNNTPNGNSWYHGLLFVYVNNTSVYQVAMSKLSGYHDEQMIYIRCRYLDNWSPWQRIPTASEIVDSYSMGDNGYVKFGGLLGGLIVQWGHRGSTAGNPSVTTYPIAFSTVPNVQVTCIDVSSGTVPYGSTYSASTTEFTTWRNRADCGYRWFAIGH